MASPSSARLKGDDYQHLFAWLHALELLMPRQQVAKIIVEDAAAISADDLTLLREPEAASPDRYHQIKFHVDYRGGYSLNVLLEQRRGESSLLQKWFRSWEGLRQARPTRPLEIHIVSNWPWESADELRRFVDGRDNALKDDFFAATGRQKPALLRAKLALHVQATLAQFDAFARTLRFHFGHDCWQAMAERVAERMEHHGLKFDENALLTAVGIVRNWVVAGRQDISKADVEAVITDRDLWLPPEARPSVNVYLTTIKEQQFDVDPDYLLDWRHYFVGRPDLRGHDAIDPTDWNAELLPALYALEARVSAESKERLVRARGMARLSAWFALGYAFCEVAGYTIEVDQQGQFWRTDVMPNADFMLNGNAPDGDLLDPDAESVAVAISVSDDLEADVRRDLQSRVPRTKAVLFLRPARQLDRRSLRDAGDAVALGDAVKEATRAFVKHHRAKRVLLYYLGPLGGACFIGHRLNAICREVQIMEWSDPHYVPTFTLT